VIPVKGTSHAKSRLGASSELALAIAVDSVAAAVAVADVVVVTTADVAGEFAELGASVVSDPGGGLNAAVSAGISSVSGGAVGVLLGDVPALQPAELADALELAAGHPLSFVPDAEGTGSVLIAALSAGDHSPRFGEGSRAAHVAAGYVELSVSVESGLRRDVDTAAQLAALGGRVGPRTAALSLTAALGLAAAKNGL
jgi:2-phospho-L-lactate guanylyltransferase